MNLKSEDPTEIRQNLKDLADRINEAQSQFDQLGRELGEMRANKDAQTRHLARIENPNARI